MTLTYNVLQAIARVLETVPLSSNTLIIRTDSQYSKKGARLSFWPLALARP